MEKTQLQKSHATVPLIRFPRSLLGTRVADPDPDLFGQSWIRKIFTGSVSGSGSYWYFGNVKLYKQGKNILKIEVLHIFR